MIYKGFTGHSIQVFSKKRVYPAFLLYVDPECLHFLLFSLQSPESYISDLTILTVGITEITCKNKTHGSILIRQLIKGGPESLFG